MRRSLLERREQGEPVRRDGTPQIGDLGIVAAIRDIEMGESARLREEAAQKTAQQQSPEPTPPPTP